MKTKFILHGGMLSYDNQHNNSFFKEFTKDLKDGDKVLFVGFAREDKEDRERVYQRDKGYILAQTEKDIVVENAEPDSFVEQAVEADAIFVTGGHTNALFADIAAKPGFYEAIKGKVYAGSSAGALITAKYYFTSSANEICEGFGWLPIRLLTHYGNPDFNGTKETRQLLETYDDALELVTLPECEWRVFEII